MKSGWKSWGRLDHGGHESIALELSIDFLFIDFYLNDRVGGWQYACHRSTLAPFHCLQQDFGSIGEHELKEIHLDKQDEEYAKTEMG